MDFGIARAVSDSAATMTSTAAVIGTAQYLSPEQARGEGVDARSDVYSARLPALRARHRRAAVHRRLPGGRGLPARARGPAAAVVDQPGDPAGARRHPAQGDEQEPGQPLPVGRRDAQRPAAGRWPASGSRPRRSWATPRRPPIIGAPPAATAGARRPVGRRGRGRPAGASGGIIAIVVGLGVLLLGGADRPAVALDAATTARHRRPPPQVAVPVPDLADQAEAAAEAAHRRPGLEVGDRDHRRPATPRPSGAVLEHRPGRRRRGRRGHRRSTSSSAAAPTPITVPNVVGLSRGPRPAPPSRAPASPADQHAARCDSARAARARSSPSSPDEGSAGRPGRTPITLRPVHRQRRRARRRRPDRGRGARRP